MSETELDALIKLLDDPDEHVFNQVKNKLLSYGNDVIPFLELAWETSLDNLLQNRIESIIHQLQFESILKGLKQWRSNPEHDLLEAALIIAKYQYPDFNDDEIKTYLQKVTRDVWLELNDHLTALEIVKVINHIVFDVHEFNGNKKSFHSPKNSYLNNVIESKKGNPLTLGIIYLHICQRLELNIYGVNLPEHFVLCYKENDEILFYINTFNKGFVFAKKDIDKFLKQLNIEIKEAYYQPCDNLTIIKQLIKNLIVSYQHLGYPEKIEELKLMLECLN
ncbi:MAG: hypothetical protein Kow0079_04960 [Vicingaceae bacterium]